VAQPFHNSLNLILQNKSTAVPPAAVARAAFLSLVKISCAITINFLDWILAEMSIWKSVIVFGFTSRATLKTFLATKLLSLLG